MLISVMAFKDSSATRLAIEDKEADARPCALKRRVTSTSIADLPRESVICRALILFIFVLLIQPSRNVELS